LPEGDLERRREISRKRALALAASAHVEDALNLTQVHEREPTER
jgi:hypothetical protein